MQIDTAVLFNSDVPAAPAGCCNIIFQSDGSVPQENVSAFDCLMVGDSGSGGYSGNVPAPAPGDAAAGKFLSANGTFAVPAGAGSSGFSSGNNSHGYWVQDLNGHIHQWGVVTTDINSSTVAVTFPTAFHTLGSISVNVSTKSATDRITFVVDGSVTTTGFTVGNNGSGGYAYWSADGDGVPSSGGAVGVLSMNSLTGALSIVAGSNVTVTPSGSSITIAASGGGGGGGPVFYSDTCSPNGTFIPSVKQSSAANGFVATLPGVTAGNVLVVSFGTEGTLGTTGVTDDHSGTWTKIAEQTGALNNISMWYSLAGSSATYTVTATAGAASSNDIILTELNNAQLAVDGNAGNYQATAPTSYGLTTTVIGDLLISACRAWHNGNTFTVPPSWQMATYANGGDAEGVATRVAPNPGTHNLLWTVTSGGTDSTASVMAAIQGITGGTDYTSTGSNGDLFMNVSTGDLFKRVSGIWVYQTTIVCSSL